MCINELSKISGYHCGVVVAFAFLGFYAVQIGSWLLASLDNLLIPSSRVKQYKKTTRVPQNISSQPPTNGA
jgi:hypothetical protein